MLYLVDIPGRPTLLKENVRVNLGERRGGKDGAYCGEMGEKVKLRGLHTVEQGETGDSDSSAEQADVGSLLNNPRPR